MQQLYGLSDGLKRSDVTLAFLADQRFNGSLFLFSLKSQLCVPFHPNGSFPPHLNDDDHDLFQVLRRTAKVVVKRSRAFISNACLN